MINDDEMNMNPLVLMIEHIAGTGIQGLAARMMNH